MTGETPSKAFEVVIWTASANGGSGSEEIVQWASDLPLLMDDYNKAIAKAAKKKDGLARNVLIRQTLVRRMV